MKTGNRVSAIVTIFIGSLVIFLSRDFPKVVSSAPGPGFFPAILGWMLIILGFILLVQTFIWKHKDISKLFSVEKNKFIYKICGIAVIYCVLLPFIGFIVSTLLFLFVLGYILGLRKRKFLTLFPIVGTILIVFIFEVLFQIPLPKQMLF